MSEAALSDLRVPEERTRRRRLAPYRVYRESEIEWLGKIPAHWPVRRLKYLALIRVSNVDKHSVDGQAEVRLCNYIDVYKNDRIAADLDLDQA